MGLSDALNRRVRARPQEDEEIYSDLSASDQSGEEVSGSEEEADGTDISDAESANDEDDSSQDEDKSDNESDNEDEDEDEDEDDDEEDGEEDIQSTLNNISFGALAKAQDSFGKRRRSSGTTTSKPSSNATSTVEDIRARLREAREKKLQESAKSNGKDASKLSRSSKHAPQILSSKHAVSRRRIVVETPAAAKPRDPRFDPTVLQHSGARSNPNAANKAYSFLDEYRASELKELKQQLSKTKNPAQKEELKRQIRSTGDRLRAIEDKKREQEIVAEHKKREKELIREGKKSTPYFLKKSDIKREMLKKKYEAMGSRERAKALERKRKKIAGKERKEMPWGRRGLEADTEAGGGGKRRRTEE
ncbi:rRNA biogenesis protein rrp36 [Paecilomyces lecythidis]|uniref:rRNA biogenesis protein RRP36 n=1 Tax=Paecilomyces lecythidis TaxID=3004212 RepID=A0ABR3WZ98_9EURO